MSRRQDLPKIKEKSSQGRQRRQDAFNRLPDWSNGKAEGRSLQDKKNQPKADTEVAEAINSLRDQVEALQDQIKALNDLNGL